MQKTCPVCHQPFSLSAKAKEILQKFPGEPEPELCFVCGQKRRLIFRNGTNLYRRTCDATGASIISSIAPEKPYTVYSQMSWWGDSWDAKSYGRPIDWNQPFFTQFRNLQLQVPRIALTNLNSENSDYCNMSDGNKNCYLIFGGDYNEDSLYGIFGMKNRSIVDCDVSNYNERCYWMCDSFHCYGCRFTFDSQHCVSCAFVSDCTGCTECILCTNLVKKSYCIRNKQLSKEAYEREKAELLLPSYEIQKRLYREFLDLRSVRTVKYAHIVSSEGCTGDYIQSSHACENCYDTWDSEDLADVILAFNAKDSLASGCVGGKGAELCYDVQTGITPYNVRHSYAVFDSSDIEYCDFVSHSKSLFGCAGMRKAEYCILNQQYSPEEFKDLRTKLIEHMKKTGEWGQFFPPEFSCFSYNESTAFMYFPITKEQALAEGFTWFDAPHQSLDVERTINAQDVPDNIDDVPDDILSWAIRCEKTAKPFKIMKQELEFYRSMRLPIPRLHPDERAKLRIGERNPIGLFARTCALCHKPIVTSYAPERPERVVCEECYLKEVY